MLETFGDAKEREDLLRFDAREFRALGPVLAVTLEAPVDEVFEQRVVEDVVVLDQDVRQIGLQVGASVSAAVTDEHGETPRQGDVESFRESLHGAAQRLEEGDLRP